MKRIALAAVCFISLGVTVPGMAQELGDRVRLESDNAAGVPVHPGDGNTAYVRWPNGTIAEIVQVGDWFKVQFSNDTGWVTSRYIIVLPDADAGELDADSNEELAYVIGTWNLENFKDGAKRGFPENSFGNAGPTYDGRDDDDYETIAGVIRDQIQSAVLVLNEINGDQVGQSGELDRLVEDLGSNWHYQLSASGGTRHVALLHDDTKAARNKCHEFVIPEKNIQGADIASRDPLACHYTLLDADGNPQNDLVIVGVHWASGQKKARNHNAGMAALASQLGGAFDGDPFDSGETDVVIAGDFNASFYSSPAENFWKGFGGSRWEFDVLVHDKSDAYPATRLARVPLYPVSQIDYVMATMVAGGLADSLVLQTAHVHHELLKIGFDEFRKHLSDHVPVTIRVTVSADDD